MPARLSRRLAGCIAIDLVVLDLILATAGLAGDFKAGAAREGAARALVLEDRRGTRAVFVQAEFAVTQALADFVAGRLLKAYELDRAALLLRGTGRATAQPEDVVNAVNTALGTLGPAAVRFDGRTLSVTAPDGRRRAAISAEGTLRVESGGKGWGEGAAVRGPIRAAFQMVEPAHGLQQRTDPVHAYPVQAIALGKQITILGLSGETSLPAGIGRKGLIFAAHANGDSAPPEDDRILAAIRKVLARVQ
jgi:hypothetical protein